MGIFSDPLHFFVVPFYAAVLLLFANLFIGVGALLAGVPSLFPLRLPSSFLGFIQLYLLCLVGYVLFLRLLAGRCQHVMADDLYGSRGTWESQQIIQAVGHQKVMRLGKPQILDKDVDGSGMPRRLLRLHVPHDEPLVCVEVQCPSTKQIHYMASA